MNKHTPRPWSHSGSVPVNSGEPWFRISDELGTQIAYVIRADHAQLIAAAPDLLEALQGLLKGIFDGPDEANAAMLIAKARDAVNNATGEK